MTVAALATRVAHAGYVDHRFFGYSTLTELLGAETCLGLNVMAVTGRRIDRESLDMLDDLAVVMTIADPRIWPLKLTRVVASYGGTLAAFAAGQLCLEGDLLGPWSTMYAAMLWDELRTSVDHAGGTGLDAEIASMVARKSRLPGYGVPFRPRDERLDALRARVVRRDWQTRRYWSMQEAFSLRVHEARGIGPNIAAGASALLLDMGFAVPDVPAIMTVLMQNNFVANAVEGARQAPAALRSLPVDTATYVGEPPRQSPRALAALRGGHLPAEPPVEPITG